METRVDKLGFTKSLYARIDAYFKLNNKFASVEIKLRDKMYEKFSTHLMEIEKYDAMVEDKKNKNLAGSFYACFFGEDVLYLYNLQNIKSNSTVEAKWCPRTTAADSDYCWKDCYMIDKNIAKVYIKENGQWNKLEN